MSESSLDGDSNDPMQPIMGSIAGNGSVGDGVNETWRTGVS